MILQPKCYDRKCIHYKGINQPDGTEQTERPYCAAFPDGIPTDIAYGKDKHLEARSGQGNIIVFEKKRRILI